MVRRLGAEEQQDGANSSEFIHRSAGSHADGTRHPDAGRRGKAAHVPVFHDDAAAQETQAAHHAGRHTRCIELVGARKTILGNNHEQAGSQGHQKVRSDTRHLAREFPLIADDPAHKRRHQNPYCKI